MDAMPIHRLAQMTPRVHENTIADCLSEAHEAINIAMQMDSRGDRERLRQWIRDAQIWLDGAERRAR